MSVREVSVGANSAAWLSELPIARVPDVADWSENYAWDAYDPKTRIAFYLHVGRWYRDPNMWRELVLVCIDGRDVFSRRNIGHLHEAQTIGASCLRLSCEVPMQRWRWRYHGPVLHGIAADLLKRPPRDDVALLMDFDLDWCAACPVIDFGHGTEPGALSSHYEQGGTLAGRLTINGKDYLFDGRAFRDHSRGPRTLERHFNRHTWIHGTFPSGRTISSLIVEMPDGKLALADLFVIDAHNTIDRYRFKPALLWDSWEDRERPYVLEGVNAENKTLRVDAQPQFSFPTTLGSPMDLFVGQSNDYLGWRVFQMPTKLIWDGEETYGHTEFTLSAEKSRQFS